MTMTPDITHLQAAATHSISRKKFGMFSAMVMLIVYGVYIVISFDILGLSQRASLDNAKILIRDSHSYKVHVTRDNRNGEMSVKIEGETKGTYKNGTSPEWVSLGTQTVVDLENEHIVTFGETNVTYDVPGFGRIWAEPSRKGVEVSLPGGEFPGTLNQSKNRLTITTEAGRLTVTRNRTEVFRYFSGWELFFFTLESPYHDLSWNEILTRAFTGESAQILNDFWNNKMWRHKDVAWAIGETILMAFIGTFGGALIALPLAFLAAKNFSPFRAVRFFMRRIFDFIRGVDALIFTIMLARAFGPGPMTGALAILITDTGTFGKLFSETLENVDNKQIEGVKSTGARKLQQYRFGVLPQVTPVILSLVLYYFESNTRSATIIGAITGGGIGLMLTQAMITQKDWEEVSYYIILIILMVMLMDWVSGQIRTRLIKGTESLEL
ncbi:phosphonate ABC transporter, permease protein PhnE [Rhodobacterales bacterium FZCC0083]|nr:phosphonate ABC transporter, permease protein PhnE [Rhodobacterales bacterium FZCC0083]